MNMTKIRLIGLSTIDLPIIGALPSDPFISKNWDGLGPPEVDVSLAPTLNGPSVYQGRRPQSREIVGLIGLNPDHGVSQTASELRTELYGLLTPGYEDHVVAQIMDGADVIAEATCYVSKLEINPFSKDPEVQITLPCLQQYLLAPETLFVEPADKDAPMITNFGSAPAGFHMEIIFTDDMSGWTLSDASGKKMQFNYAFLTGDKLEIDTRPGLRGIWLTRAGVITNLIYILSTDSIWYMLHGGDNVFATSNSNFSWGDVFYQPQHWGI